MFKRAQEGPIPERQSRTAPSLPSLCFATNVGSLSATRQARHALEPAQLFFWRQALKRVQSSAATNERKESSGTQRQAHEAIAGERQPARLVVEKTNAIRSAWGIVIALLLGLALLSVLSGPPKTPSEEDIARASVSTPYDAVMSGRY
jgi:hypothetical protein